MPVYGLCKVHLLAFDRLAFDPYLLSFADPFTELAELTNGMRFLHDELDREIVDQVTGKNQPKRIIYLNGVCSLLPHCLVFLLLTIAQSTGLQSRISRVIIVIEVSPDRRETEIEHDFILVRFSYGTRYYRSSRAWRRRLRQQDALHPSSNVRFREGSRVWFRETATTRSNAIQEEDGHRSPLGYVNRSKSALMPRELTMLW